MTRGWKSKEVIWLIRITQLFRGWIETVSLHLLLPQCITQVSPGERLTLGRGRLSKFLLCHVRVGGVTPIHSASPGPETSLLKATHDLYVAASCGHSLSPCYLTFQQIQCCWLLPPSWNTFSSRLLWWHNDLFLCDLIDHFVWCPLLNSPFLADIWMLEFFMGESLLYQSALLTQSQPVMLFNCHLTQMTCEFISPFPVFPSVPDSYIQCLLDVSTWTPTIHIK